MSNIAVSTLAVKAVGLFVLVFGLVWILDEVVLALLLADEYTVFRPMWGHFLFASCGIYLMLGGKLVARFVARSIEKAEAS